MTNIDATRDSLADLLAQLEKAVSAGDRNGAALLEQRILKRLATESSNLQDAERQARSLMEGLAEHKPAPKSSFSLTGQLSAPSPDAKPAIYPVWFGTNRKPAPGGGYTGERDGAISRGRVEVKVPAAHRFGEAGNAFWQRLLRFELRDDRLRVQRVTVQDSETFFGDLREAMGFATQSGQEPSALFFLHGFNVTFEDAAIRAAQIGFDLKVPGATAFFSWPSRGSVTAYSADEASIEASEGAITDFLVEFAAQCGAAKVHIIAHSMGNRGLLRALQRIASNAETRGKVKFGQIFLAAPDVDRDLFLDLAHLYSEHAQRATLYSSDADLAVHASSKLHAAPRAGYFTPHTVAAGIDTVAVPNFDIDLLGHSYFAQAEALLHDIYDLIRHNEPPGQRQRIEAATGEGQAFWSLRR